MRRMPVIRLVSLKVPEASIAAYTSYPAAVAAIAGKARQTSIEIAAIMSFLRPVAAMAFTMCGSSQAFTVVRSIISTPDKTSVSSGIVGPQRLSREVGDYGGNAKHFSRLRQPHYVVLELRDVDVPDSREQAELMVDEQQRRVICC